MNLRQQNYTSNDEYAFFDMDGTLVETDYANFLAYKEAIKMVTNQDADLSFNPSIRFNQHTITELNLNLSNLQYKRISQLKKSLFPKYLSTTFVNSNVVEQFINLSTSKTVVLVTNAHSQRARQTMAHHGLGKFVDYMLCADDRDQQSNKYQHAIDTFSASPSQVIVFENEDKEIMNTLSAGMKIQNITKV